jgi:hypothetical protein
MEIDFSVEACAIHIADTFDRDDHLLVIEKDGSKIIAACGAVLMRPYFPPYPLTVAEYLWYGSNKKAIARTWNTCMEWGKAHGAKFAHYGLNKAQSNGKKWVEVHKWRAL